MKILSRLLIIFIALIFMTILVIGAARIFFSGAPESDAHLSEKSQYLKGLTQAESPPQRPNIIFILFDDLGYGDIGSFSGTSIKTPRIDQLANEGLKFTNFYAPAPNCTPSRAGYLSGRMPIHTGLPNVIFPENSKMDLLMRALGNTQTRLPNDEILLSEYLRSVGYSTQMIGKWHLGDVAPSLPNNFGFDDFYGVRYSNDMTPMHIYHNDKIVEQHPVDQTRLTENYTKTAIQFIDTHKDRPFFLYMAHSFPHIPLYASSKQRGKSDAGLYGDVVADLDNSVGQLVDTLKANHIDSNTLIFITSDNGPWFQGNPGPHRGRKNDTFDGGMAVPLVAYWPGGISQPATVDELASGLDIVPTVLDLLGLPLPTDRIIDGVSMKPMLLERRSSQRDTLYYNSGASLFAARDARFKYQDQRMIEVGGIELSKVGFAKSKGPWLFDLTNDPNESYNVAEKHPEVFDQLQKRFQQQAKSLQENPRGWIPLRK